MPTSLFAGVNSPLVPQHLVCILLIRLGHENTNTLPPGFEELAMIKQTGLLFGFFFFNHKEMAKQSPLITVTEVLLKAFCLPN